MVVLQIENSNWELTIDIVGKMIAPDMKAQYKSLQCDLLCDNFNCSIKDSYEEIKLKKYPAKSSLNWLDKSHKRINNWTN